MIQVPTDPSITQRAAVILFDGAHARVICVRGTRIEDAREYTVAAASAAGSRNPAVSRQAPLTGHQLQQLAMRVSRVAAALHVARPFDYVFVVGPPRAQAYVWASLATPLRRRLVGPLSLPVDAGEGAVLRAVLTELAAARHRAAHVPQLPTAARPAPPSLRRRAHHAIAVPGSHRRGPIESRG